MNKQYMNDLRNFWGTERVMQLHVISCYCHFKDPLFQLAMISFSTICSDLYYLGAHI